ncbi:alpha/beta hydrolase [Novosphingobium sp. Gsoil 351]|uniref:alpha/beta hydrolase n=1 Tax=Novosphingobium sp. Gsoil 351 TaxID=2675225 RepID=UPI0012B46CD1|nr:alpha/beta hydrolase [Novosphingobium sp. Gsoil 351]QGN55120.1 alpha/beta hydrolase fold domain-containing protein [Novosphingobium sp. Gsoil 351]
MGWLGWTGAMLLLAALALGALTWWALSNDSAATLDALDANFSRNSTIAQVAAANYAADPAQKLEMFVPAGAVPAGGFPLVVFFHGGGWHEGDPHDYHWIARALGEKGYATALVGYRLNAAGRFPAMLEDSAAGARWALAHAAEYKIDPSRVVLMGHSAGAYNASMLTLDRQWLGREGVPEATVKGAVVLAGPADFYPFDKKSSINAMSHWPRPADTQPINFVRADAPPMLLVHGTRDTIVRPRNALILARKLTEAGVPTKATLIDGVGHIAMVVTLAHPFDWYDHRVADAVFPFLARVLPPAPASSPVQAAAR